MQAEVPPDAPPVHLAEAERVRLAILRRLTPGQRWEQAQRLRARMLELLEAGIRQRNPDWGDARVRRALASTILHART